MNVLYEGIRYLIESVYGICGDYGIAVVVITIIIRLCMIPLHRKQRKALIHQQTLNLQIEEIKNRNKRVELDKECETSMTRKLCICILTYLVVVLYSYSIETISNIFLSSLVPVIGFTLSTLSLNFIRKIWEKRIKREI